MTLFVEVRNLYKYFGEAHAVDGISLHLQAGEIYGLMGPDGAGKTTALRLMCGALQPSHLKGQPAPVVQIAGIDLLRHTEQARAQIGYLAQRFSLYDDLTVLENIRFFAEVRGIPATEWRPRCMQILEFVGLAEFINRRAAHLSGGMRQKLGLAAALIHRPRVLLLDEPTTGVDPVTRQDFWQLIIRLVAQDEQEGIEENHGTAVLVSTPYMDEAARCQRVGLMYRGSLIREGTPAELCQTMDGQILELVGQPLPSLRCLAQADEGVENVQMFGDRLHLRVHVGQAEAVIARLSESISAHSATTGGAEQVTRLRLIPPQLEDVFMGLLGKKA